MSEDRLEENLKIFYEQMDDRLKDLSPKEQQQYLEGLVHAFDAITRYASPEHLTPVEKEEFIGSAKTWAYSKTHHLKLDPEKRMRSLVETDSDGVAKSYVFAARVQEAMGIILSNHERMRLQQLVFLFHDDKYNSPRKVE